MSSRPRLQVVNEEWTSGESEREPYGKSVVAGSKWRKSPYRRTARPKPEPKKEVRMSDPISREEIELRAKLTEAQTDKKFAELLGEFRTSQAQVIGKIDALTILSTEAKDAAEEAKRSAQLTRWNTVFLVLGLFAAVIALAALGAQVLATGKELFEMGAAVK